MAACEKCWRAAGGDPDRYAELILSRPACTPEEQAGPESTECPECKRKTVHQFAHRCMICGWTSQRRLVVESPEAT